MDAIRSIHVPVNGLMARSPPAMFALTADGNGWGGLCTTARSELPGARNNPSHFYSPSTKAKLRSVWVFLRPQGRGGGTSQQRGVGARHDHIMWSDQKTQPVARRSHPGDLCNRSTEQENLKFGFLRKRLEKRVTPHDRLHSS